VYAIADVYRQGISVSADPERAAALYRTVAEQGNVVAQLNLGDLIGHGFSVGRDAAGANSSVRRRSRSCYDWHPELNWRV
jgi:TPR repeat protein